MIRERASRYIELLRAIQQFPTRQRIAMSMARAAATSNTREISMTDPGSWEFCAFSQNGEDGILDVLTRQLKDPNGYFVEIGASDGLENNTTWLALGRRYSGLMVEGNPQLVATCRQVVQPTMVDVLSLLVTSENVGQVSDAALRSDPDVFSLDIDGNDYYVVKALLEAGVLPRIWMVEFNSAFGPEKSLTIPYDPGFRLSFDRKNRVYYGCSITGWRNLFAQWGYHFVTGDRNGVDAVFLDPTHFEPQFVSGIRPLEFAENVDQMRVYRGGWGSQLPVLEGRPLVEIPSTPSTGTLHGPTPKGPEWDRAQPEGPTAVRS